MPLRTVQRYVYFLTPGDFEDAETGETKTTHALLCTSMYSRHQFVWPCLGETQKDLFEGLDAAWRFFGAVFPVVVSDNPRTVVDVPDPVSPKLNLAFVEYMQSRDFEVDTCRVRTPTDKPRVERQVQSVRSERLLPGGAVPFGDRGAGRGGRGSHARRTRLADCSRTARGGRSTHPPVRSGARTAAS